MEVRYYICKHCGNIVEKVKDKGVPVICCGEPMQELKAGVTDAAVEKHVPVYTIEGSHVHVVVGETKHPMLEEHFIDRKSTRLNSSHITRSRMPSSA